MKVTALAGGTGAAKLVRGLVGCPELGMGGADLTIIGNTGDDTEVWGLHVSPDLDSVMYALAGLLDRGRGWGRVDETWECRDAMATLGAPTWFNLGDRDLATHLTRTAALRGGRSLSDVTLELTRGLGIAARLVPMSDDPVRTRVRTPETWLTFQEYFVRERARVKVLEVEYDGAERARPAPGVLTAIADADLVVVCPSNPITSIGPILAVPGIAGALVTTRARVVAVSPIVGSAAVSGPAGELMRARGLPVSPVGVATAYAPWLDALVIDTTDATEVAGLGTLGATALLADIVMTDAASEVTLARRVLGAA
jgi:LPPG:FO 2-phospho-L-lactate transferase